MNIFGEKLMEKYAVGDMVSWIPIGYPKEFGLIKRIFTEELENEPERKFAFAEIITSTGKHHELHLDALELESKRISKQK